jgi:hypothetical protein
MKRRCVSRWAFPSSVWSEISMTEERLSNGASEVCTSAEEYV